MLFDFQHRFNAPHMIGRRINMGARSEKAHRDRPINIGKGAINHLLTRSDLSKLTPKRYAFKQGS